MRHALVLLALAAGCYDSYYERSTPASAFTLSWRLRAGTETGPEVSCQPGDVVVLTSRAVGTDFVSEDRFACADGTGTTADLPGGYDYDLVIDLRDASGTVLSSATARRALDPRTVADLGLVVFVVEAAPTGNDLVVGLAWSRTAAGDVGCAGAAPAGAADVHRIEFELYDGNGARLFTSAPLGAGACETISGEACAAQLSFGALPFGSYRLSIVGYSRTCAPCWPRQSFVLRHDGGGPQVVTVARDPGCTL